MGRRTWRPLGVRHLAACVAGVGVAFAVGALDVGASHGGGLRTVPLAEAVGAATLPYDAQAAFSSTVGGEESLYTVVRRGHTLITRGGGLESEFGQSGPRVDVGGGRVTLRLMGVGYGRSLGRVDESTPTAAGSSVLYRHKGFTEWYRNGPLGLEQGFTLRRPVRLANNNTSVVIALRVAGELIPKRVKAGVAFLRRAGGAPVLLYGGLNATDAQGRSLPARMQVNGRIVLLRVGAAGARYPITVDPFIQKGAVLTGRDEVASRVTGPGEFGFSSALSANGNIALIGSYGDDGEKGAAWVFTRRGSTWREQGPKLHGANEIGAGGEFGFSVALSADGNTALIGGPTDNGAVGAAWVFTRRGSSWTQEAKLLATPADGPQAQDRFGVSVALSADGKTALVGADEFYNGNDDGAVAVFKRSNSSIWTWQGESGGQGKVLIAKGEIGDSEFGSSIAMSADGNIAVIGAPNDHQGIGAAWIFTRSGAVWKQTSKLMARDEPGAAEFGYSVALSSNGTLAIIGGFSGSYDNNAGRVWVFTRSRSIWRQTSVLSPSEASPGNTFGFSVTLSADGKTALIGGPNDGHGLGAVWVFVRSGSVWRQTSKLTARDERGAGEFGYSVALAADDNVALIGGPRDDDGVGAAWVETDAA